jgi:hypothetical protein
MKSLLDYIFEKEEKDEKDEKKSSDKKDNKKKLPIERKDMVFTVWESPDKKVQDLTSNDAYQKIEYKLIEKKSGLAIDFLLGFKDNSWHLWVGKIGSCSYDDEPYKNLNTTEFKSAVVASLDTIEEFLEKVLDDPMDYVQFYKNI